MLIAAGLLTLGMNAQNKTKSKLKNPKFEKCASVVYESRLQKTNPGRSTNQQFENWIALKIEAKKAQRSAQSVNSIVTIPVVFHIIHNGDAIGVNENLAAAQIESQITTLNQDFRKMLGTNGYNENPVGEDMEIEFCLAKRDAYGLYTTGIERYNMGNELGFNMSQVEIIKTQTQWDPEKFLNIWVFENIIGLGGYAQFPTESGLDGLEGQTDTANTDGVALTATIVGSQEIYPEGYYQEGTTVLGRIASHEIGHFFGLRHIWGDMEDCEGTDYCEDTPTATQPNRDCPTGLDSCEDNPGEDMIENYMDYTNDLCQNIFTINQKDRMQAVLTNSPRRISLTTSDGCTPGIINENDGSLQIRSEEGFGSCNPVYTPQIYLTNKGNIALTTATISYQIDNEAPAIYSWEGDLAYGEETDITLPEINLNTGDHTFNVHMVLANGVTDQAASNDVKQIQFSTVSTFTTTQITINIMTDDYGNETLWALVDADENPIATNLNVTNIFASDFIESNTLFTTTVDIPASGCYTFGIYDLEGDGICCEYGMGYYTITTGDGTEIARGGEFFDTDIKTFSVQIPVTATTSFNKEAITLYPNPSHSVLNIAVPQATTLPDTYTVYNNLGQMVNTGKINSNNQELNISGYANGVYFIKLNGPNTTQTLQFIKY